MVTWRFQISPPKGALAPDQQDVELIVDEPVLPRIVAFTGTPLIAGEERTREVFGDYVSIYDFQQSVEDNATVRCFTRTARLPCI